MTERTAKINTDPLTIDVDPVVVAMGRLDDGGLRLTVAAVETAGFPFLLARSTADAYLGSLPAALDPTAYEDGRVFGQAGELLWRREEWLTGDALNRGWRVVFIGSRANCPPPLTQAEFLELGEHNQRRVTALLWGERRAGQTVWMEPRIPRTFDYDTLIPGTPGRVGVVVIQYIKDGQVDFVRFLGFAEWPAAEGNDA